MGDQRIYGEAPDSGEESGGREEGPSSGRRSRESRRSSCLKMRDNLLMAGTQLKVFGNFSKIWTLATLGLVIFAMLACVIPDLSHTVPSLQDLLIVQNTLTLGK